MKTSTISKMIAKCVSYVSKHLSSQTLRWPWRGEKCTHFSFVYNENLAVPACVANQLFFLSKETIHCQILSTDYWLSKYHKATGPRLSLHVRSEEFPNFPVPVLSLWTTSNFMNCRNTTFWFAWIAQALWFFLTLIFCSVQIYTFIKKKNVLSLESVDDLDNSHRDTTVLLLINTPEMPIRDSQVRLQTFKIKKKLHQNFLLVFIFNT